MNEEVNPPMEHRVSYKHLRNENGKLFCTICTIDTDLFTATGVALCSHRDNFSRKIGRALALKRANKALLSKRNSLQIAVQLIDLLKKREDQLADLGDLMILSAKHTRISVMHLMINPKRDKFVPVPYKSIFEKKEA